MVLVSHDMLRSAVKDKVLFLDKGRIIESDSGARKRTKTRCA